MGRLGSLVRKEFLQFLRRKPLIVLIIWTIAVEIAICASSITYDVSHLPLAVQDLDGSPASRELTARFGRMPYFDDRYRAGAHGSSTTSWRAAGRPSDSSSRPTSRVSSARGSRPQSSFSCTARTPIPR